MPEVKATLFIHPAGRVLLAAASWSKKAEKVRFKFDLARLPENLRDYSGLAAVAVQGFQEEKHYSPDDPIEIAPGKGVWLTLEN